MKKKSICQLLLFSIFFCGISSCKKYLDEKSSKMLVVPSSIADAQALMDDIKTMTINSIMLNGTLMDDNYYLLTSTFNSRSVEDQNNYIWAPLATVSDNEWRSAYLSIAYSNTALTTLNKIAPSENDLSAFQLAKGSALFSRAFIHFQLALLFAPQYQVSSSNKSLGIPYKLSADVQDVTKRLTVEDTYQMIIKDFKEAAALLPLITGPVSRPSKVAAFGALARVYLSMNDYPHALLYADSCLQKRSELLNYNTLDSTTTKSPFPLFGKNVEDLFHAASAGTNTLNYPNLNCDSLLIKSYKPNDLRRKMFFRQNQNGLNTYSFKGAYDAELGAAIPYSGIATDEIFLIRSECYARQGNIRLAMDDLNTLLVTRWTTGTFTPFAANTAADALNIILNERRKELAFRCNLRWSDLKRLNVDPSYAKPLTRVIGGVLYSLPANDLRYALLIPNSVIQTSGITQNPR
jgi:hypothetical protein